jgi:hypothetical protein
MEQQLSFKFGNGIDNLVRQGYWFENRKDWAIRVLKCLDGISEKQIQDVLNGDAQLLGKDDCIELEYKEDAEFKNRLEEWLVIHERNLSLGQSLEDYQIKWLKKENLKRLKYGEKECIVEALNEEGRIKKIWDFFIDILINDDEIMFWDLGEQKKVLSEFNYNSSINSSTNRYMLIDNYYTLNKGIRSRFFSSEFFNNSGYGNMQTYFNNRLLDGGLLIDMDNLKAYAINKAKTVAEIKLKHFK